MKRIFWMSLLAMFLSSCTFSVAVENPITPTATINIPTTTATNPNPGPTPAPTIRAIPRFTNIHFVADVTIDEPHWIFPARSRRIYAVWDYQNMREGMMVRRDWYRDDVLWITRSEAWDFKTYGANGTIRDISVYDLENGLVSGEYRLELYIDTQPQPLNESQWPTFEISADESVRQLSSPDGQWVASADDPTLLLVRDAGNNARQLFKGDEIADLTWLLDNRHLVFVDRDRSNQKALSPFGVRDTLWIVDVATGELHMLFQNDTALFGSLVVSPDNQYIAGVEGSGYSDACSVDSRVVVFALDKDLQSVRRYGQSDFNGIPVNAGGVAYPTDSGEWQSAIQLLIPLDFTCTTDATLKGDYFFDMTTLHVEKSDQ
jgi:hypothetical protein